MSRPGGVELAKLKEMEKGIGGGGKLRRIGIKDCETNDREESQ